MFARDLGRLLTYISEQPNYGCTGGDWFRDERVHGKYGEKKSYSSAKSDHKLKLAVDLHLFFDGQYQTDTEAHRQFGEYWKNLSPDNYWGGDFKSNPDGNHYGRHWPGK